MFSTTNFHLQCTVFIWIFPYCYSPPPKQLFLIPWFFTLHFFLWRLLGHHFCIFFKQNLSPLLKGAFLYFCALPMRCFIFTDKYLSIKSPTIFFRKPSFVFKNSFLVWTNFISKTCSTQNNQLKTCPSPCLLFSINHKKNLLVLLQLKDICNL